MGLLLRGYNSSKRIEICTCQRYSYTDELSVIGKGNSILSQYCYPLTTVDGNYEYICVTAVNMLVRHFEGLDAPNKTTISSQFIRRNSTKKR